MSYLSLTVFFFPYALFEVPSNMMLKVLKPSIWIGIMMLTWGTIMTLMGIVKDYTGLSLARAAVSAYFHYAPVREIILTEVRASLEQPKLAFSPPVPTF